jgi:hypothetical protein
MEDNAGKQQGRGCLMSSEDVYSPQTEEEHQAWLDEYAQAEGWANHEEALNQQRQEGRKMAEWAPQDDTITLFMNDRRESEKHPLMTGKGLVKGQEVRAAAWKNTSKKGVEYMSIKISEPQDNAKRYDSPKTSTYSQSKGEVPF